MSKKKFYAVVKGRRPGIYDVWFGRNGAEIQITGFPRAIYKGFSSRGEAQAWFNKMSEESLLIPRGETGAPVEAATAVGEPPTRPEPIIEEASIPGTVSADRRVTLYTDGGCIRNPGPGGYGVVLLYGGRRKEISGGCSKTTNNRMELTACIKGLEALKEKCSVMIHSDSQYVVKGMGKGWAKRWKRNNWKRNDTDIAENSDLWSQLLDLCEKHEVKFLWVRGHHGNPENERCDRLAREIAQRKDLPPDYGYGRKRGSRVRF